MKVSLFFSLAVAFESAVGFTIPGPQHRLLGKVYSAKGFGTPDKDSPKDAKDETPAKDVKDTLSMKLAKDTSTDPLEDMTDERKENLFQALLRDLGVEGVPVLDYNAAQVHTFQAALWTTMAQLNDNEEAGKACLVLEKMSVDVLRTFADDFMALKSEERLVKSLPELERFSISLVGKGVGPAVVVEALGLNETSIVKTEKEDLEQVDPTNTIGALESFMGRMETDKEHAGGNGEVASPAKGPQAFRVTKSNAIDALTLFWTCICELYVVPAEQQGGTVLMVPLDTSFEHFTATCELASRTLYLFGGDEKFGLLNLHPSYERNSAFPKELPAPGHLPPASPADTSSSLMDYQRRSPVPAIIIERVSMAEGTSGPEGVIVDLDLGEGNVAKESDVDWYAKRLVELSKLGEDQLKTQLEAEIKLAATR